MSPFVGTCRFLSRRVPHYHFLSVFPYWDLKPTLCPPGRLRSDSPHIKSMVLSRLSYEGFCLSYLSLSITIVFICLFNNSTVDRTRTCIVHVPNVVTYQLVNYPIKTNTLTPFGLWMTRIIHSVLVRGRSRCRTQYPSRYRPFSRRGHRPL